MGLQMQSKSSIHYKLRRHDKKLTKARPRLDIRIYYRFSQRVVNRWKLERITSS